MNYRFATVEDAEILASLVWQMSDEDKPLDPALRAGYVHDCAGHLAERLGRDLFCWVAEACGRIVAHVFVFVVQKMPKPGRGVPKWGRISSVQTIPEFRNTGIGSALMEKVVAWCKAERLEELVVWPSERSVPFYERAGFKGENKIMEADIWPWE